MCLIAETERQIASEDIIVFKIFTKDNKSPYLKFDYTPYIGKQYDDPLQENNVECGGLTAIGKGFIHSYLSLDSAKNEIPFLENIHDRTGYYLIRKCVIPKGIEYYIDMDWPKIASKSIIIGDIAYGSNIF